MLGYMPAYPNFTYHGYYKARFRASEIVMIKV